MTNPFLICVTTCWMSTQVIQKLTCLWGSDCSDISFGVYQDWKKRVCYLFT